MPTIRAYRNEDLDAVIAVFMSAVRVVSQRDYTRAQVMAWAPDHVDRTEWASRRASRPTWVAELAGAVIGFADLEQNGHLDMMFVHSDHQGRGVASALLREIEAEARRRKLPRLFTEASITARPFFDRRGFSVLAQQSVVRRGQTFTNFRMEKLLA